MAGSLIPVSRQIGKSFFQKFVGDFIEQALVDEANEQMGTTVNTAPSLGGGTATFFRKILKSGSGKGTAPQTPTPGPSFTPGFSLSPPLFPTPPQPQSQSRVGIEKASEKTGEFHKEKSKIYITYKIDNKKHSVKEELFAVMAASIIWFCNKVHRGWQIPQRLAALRRYIEGLTEKEAAEQLGIWTERRNRDNISKV